jgi:hypothetical protein
MLIPHAVIVTLTGAGDNSDIPHVTTMSSAIRPLHDAKPAPAQTSHIITIYRNETSRELDSQWLEVLPSIVGMRLPGNSRVRMFEENIILRHVNLD